MRLLKKLTVLFVILGINFGYALVMKEDHYWIFGEASPAAETTAPAVTPTPAAAPGCFILTVKVESLNNNASVSVHAGRINTRVDTEMSFNIPKFRPVTLKANEYIYSNGHTDKFIGWEGSITGSKNPVKFSMNRNISIIARFIRVSVIPTGTPTPRIPITTATPVSSPTPAPVITSTPMVTSTIRTPTRIRTSSPHPPVYSVTAYPATNITATSAVLHATLTLIEPGLGILRDDYFHWNGYSADKTWSFDTHSINFVYGGQYSMTLTGLAPNTTYYFRAYAYGTYGQYRSFTTLPLDDTPTPTPVPEPTPAPTPVNTCVHQDPGPGHHHMIISGCVHDGNTGQGIAGAKVSIHHTSTATDRKGRYRIHLKNMKPVAEPVTLIVEAAGYLTQMVLVNSVPGKINQDFYLIPQTVSTPTLVPDGTPSPVRTVTPYRTSTPIRSVVLTVSVTPDGCGSVYVNPPGISVNSTMKLTYPCGTEVTLSASLFSQSHYIFGTWQGAVTGRQNPITITMDTHKSVTAKYYWSLPPTPRPSPTPISIITPTPIITATPIGAPTPTPTVTPLNTNMIKAQLFNQYTAATSSQIFLNFRLVNISTGTIALSDVKMRYYYTNEGAQSQNFYVDYAQVGGVNVTGTFASMDTPKIGADTYLDVGFKSGAGSLAAGAGTVIQSRVAKSDWTNFTQTNDYSFNPLATTYADWPKVTGYINGVLQWGVEP